ncbi:S8 family peptidase [Candidatus Methylospira mobilis]|nr:S8 family serine peptidase [Candidatus Methylospira mobilis]
MTASYTRAQNIAAVSGNIYAPGDYLTIYAGVAQNNANTFVIGTLGDVNISNAAYGNDTASGNHTLYSLQVAGSYKSYTVSGYYGLVTLANTQNNQIIQFQLTRPMDGANNSGVDVKFADGDLAFTSNVSNGSWTAWVTHGGGAGQWGVGSQALPATQIQTPLSLNTLDAGTLNLSAGNASWSSTTGFGAINLNSALSLATGQAVTHIATPSPQTLNWGVGAANFQDAWHAGYTGKGITIADIDTGIDLNNPALTLHLSPLSTNIANPGASIQNLDSGSHGSLVASQMIAAPASAGVAGSAAVTGGAYEATLMELQTSHYDAASNSAVFNNADIATAINYAVQNGANIINLSLGGSTLDSSVYAAMQNASKQGVIITVAAGNNAQNSPDFPAYLAKSMGNVIAAGATQYSANNTSGITQASFSNQAGMSTAYDYVDAPGAYLLGYGTMTSAGQTAPVKVASGTSLAAPLVAAEAAILEQAIKAITPGIDPLELAAEVIHDITVGLVGVAANMGTAATNPYA